MFYFFKPTKKNEQENTILKNIAKYLSKNKNSYFDAYKFILYDPKIKMYGGVFFQQKKISSFIPSNILNGRDKHVWVLEDIFFEIENNFINENLDDFRWHYQQFFRNVYEMLTNFSINYNVNKVFTFFDNEDHKDSLYFGKWPFDWEIRELDDKILGCLILERQTYLQYSKEWDKIDEKKY